jgi:hypothetical protein
VVDRDDAAVDPEPGDGAATNAVVDEFGGGGLDRLVADESAKHVHRYTSMRDHDDHSVADAPLDVQ